MYESTSLMHTKLATRYLTQLCKHFEHKLSVTHGEGAGLIRFSAGDCRLTAEGDTLRLDVSTPEEAMLTQLEGVIERHLARFAFREETTLSWQRQQESQPA